MLTKHKDYNRMYSGPAHPGALELERHGHTFLRGALEPETLQALRAEVLEVFASTEPDRRKNCMEPVRGEMFRYEMFNRGALCQAVLGHRSLLDVVEPLLGNDCHVVAQTAWRNPADPEHAPRGQEWHVDGGPHVPRPPGVAWPDAIPYPVFVVAAQIYLDACGIEDGPTAVLPGSHRSGALPPHLQRFDLDLTYEGRGAVAHVAEPGDIGFVCSDAWHRRLPPRPEGSGRFFLQINFGRREIAQRVWPSEAMAPVREAARERADSLRGRQLIGLHEPGFYDG